MHLLQRLNRDGITIILVTHEPDIARFARRILRFRDGRIVDATTLPDPTPPDVAGISHHPKDDVP
jgi:ABC-type lipoprotein export system ATPase subunit